jgi:hypothetical protein
MAYDRDHAVAAAKLLDEWNMPTPIIEAVAAHHASRSRFDLVLWAGMTVVSTRSPARCHDVPFAQSIRELGLEGHVESVRIEATRYADAILGDQAPTEPAERPTSVVALR